MRLLSFQTDLFYPCFVVILYNYDICLVVHICHVRGPRYGGGGGDGITANTKMLGHLTSNSKKNRCNG